jgi:hypothetical protein
MQGYARSKAFWIRFGWGLLPGLLGAIRTLIFVTIINWGSPYSV